MNVFKRLNVLFFLVFFSKFSFSDVWKVEEEKVWTKEYQEMYSNWVRDKVGTHFFKKLGSPFKDMKMDCADFHYALQIYFSWENKLPFAISLKERGKDEPTLTQASNRFNRYGEEGSIERMAALLEYVIDTQWTEPLARRQTYPMAVKDIRPGDIFMKKYGTDAGYTRHTYIIKEVNEDGTLDILYSTQIRAKSNLPPKAVNNTMFKDAPFNRGVDLHKWGFRRMKMPQDAETDQSEVEGYSIEQYELVAEHGGRGFFQKVEETLRTIEAAPKDKLNRYLRGICREVKDRIKFVDSSLEDIPKINVLKSMRDAKNLADAKGEVYEFPVSQDELQDLLGMAVSDSVFGENATSIDDISVDSNDNVCMSYRYYDIHSTPSRDTGIKKSYDDLKAYYNSLTNVEIAKVDQQIPGLTSFIELIYGEVITPSSENILYNFCPIDVGSEGNTQKVNIGTFRKQLFAGEVSYHPMDDLFHRWGLVSENNKTDCYEPYGYPEDEQDQNEAEVVVAISESEQENPEVLVVE